MVIGHDLESIARPIAGGRGQAAFGLRSAFEGVPAGGVAWDLIRLNEGSDSLWEVGALPVRLQPVSVGVVRFGGLGRPDGLRRGTEVVFRHVRHTRGLSG